MFKFTKQPSEIIVGIGIDFIKRLSPGETITDHEVLFDEDGVRVLDSWVAGSKVLATIEGGEDGKNSKLTYYATTSNGQRLESEILVLVREK